MCISNSIVVIAVREWIMYFNQNPSLLGGTMSMTLAMSQMSWDFSDIVDNILLEINKENVQFEECALLLLSWMKYFLACRKTLSPLWC